jgi:hypothetical protein
MQGAQCFSGEISPKSQLVCVPDSACQLQLLPALRSLGVTGDDGWNLRKAVVPYKSHFHSSKGKRVEITSLATSGRARLRGVSRILPAVDRHLV